MCTRFLCKYFWPLELNVDRDRGSLDLSKGYRECGAYWFRWDWGKGGPYRDERREGKGGRERGTHLYSNCMWDTCPIPII